MSKHVQGILQKLYAEGHITFLSEAYLGAWARRVVTSKSVRDPSVSFYLSDDGELEQFEADRISHGKTKGSRYVLFGIRIDEDERIEVREPSTKGAYGDYAKTLRLSSFLRTPSVWPLLGTDVDYRGWLRTQKCAHCKAEASIEAAHVRRVSRGSGIGIKPEYSSIPLCHTDHAETHQHGESALGHDGGWFDERSIHYLQQWGWEKLRKHMNVDSMADCPPARLYAWCQDNDIARHLPGEYRPDNFMEMIANDR